MKPLFLTLPALISFFITYISIPSIIKVAREKHLFDEPNETRKSHHTSIPTLGGIAIFGGVLISFFFWVDFSGFPQMSYLMSAAVLLFFTGVKDDIIPLTPRKKFIAQILASLIVVFRCDIRLTSLYGFLGIETLPYEISVFISVFTLLVIINSFNLIDGINGLAGGVGLISSSTFAVIFYYMEEVELMVLALAMSGALLAFLKYNLAVNAKIFMGDTGALMVGLFLAVFSIQFIELNNNGTYHLFRPDFAPVFAIAILIVPLFDTLRVVILRVFSGKSPFSGDRKHLHHFLIDSGLAHWQASILLYVINLSFILMILSFKTFSQSLLIIGMLLLATLLSYILFTVRSRKLDADNEKQELELELPANPQTQTNKFLKQELSSE